MHFCMAEMEGREVMSWILPLVVVSLDIPLVIGGLIVGLIGVALLAHDFMSRDRFDPPKS